MSEATPLELNGIDTYQRSDGVEEIGTALVLTDIPADSTEWGMYRFNPGDEEPVEITIQLDDPATDNAWLALANHDTQRWEFFGPFGQTQTLDVADPKYMSGIGDIYISVMAGAGEQGWVYWLKLGIVPPPNQPPVASIEALPQSGEAGENSILTARNSTDPDGKIVLYEWDLDGDGTYEVVEDFSEHTFTYLPDPAGEAVVGLRITDDDGATAVSSLTLTSVPLQFVSVEVQRVGDPQFFGKFSSLALINGKPAIAFNHFEDDAISFAYSTAPDGSSGWSSVVIESLSSIEGYLSMAEVGGFPAVCYPDYDNDVIKFAVSAQPDGSRDWSIVTVGPGAKMGSDPCLREIEGRPAISYSSAVNDDLIFASNALPDGTGAWNLLTLDSAGNVGDASSLAIIDGLPAISYHSEYAIDDALKYVRAVDSAGVAWETPITVAGDQYTYYGFDTTLLETSANPLILFRRYDGDLGHEMLLASAADKTGTSWNAPDWPVLDYNGSSDCSMALIGGRPAICSSAWDQIRFSQATDATGTDWEPALTVAHTRNVSGCSLAEINGQPAVSYVDENSLMYAYLPDDR